MHWLLIATTHLKSPKMGPFIACIVQYLAICVKIALKKGQSPPIF
jgi:hypothetical protein